jgi:hypothetical protein
MTTKFLHKAVSRTRPVARRGDDGFDLPTVESAKARLHSHKGLFASISAEDRAAFVNHDAPVLVGPQNYRKP